MNGVGNLPAGRPNATKPPQSFPRAPSLSGPGSGLGCAACAAQIQVRRTQFWLDRTLGSERMEDDASALQVAEARNLFEFTIRKFEELGATDESDFDLADLVPENWRNEDRLQVARSLLISVGILATWQGSARVSRGTGSREPLVYGAILGAAEKLIEGLRKAPGRSLTKAECSSLLDDDEHYPTAANLLKLLRIAVGQPGRSGGLILPEGGAVPPPPPPPPPVEEVKKNNDERAFYPAAEEFLLGQIIGDSEVRITGGEMVRRGPWSNPDVVGYKIEPCNAQETAVVRAFTIEVKLALHRQGIAEASSHRRFAHFSWLAVPISRSALEAPEMQELVRECVDAGIGLACYRQADSRQFYPYLPARFASPDMVQVDELLSHAFDAAVVRSRLRRARARIIAEG